MTCHRQIPSAHRCCFLPEHRILRICPFGKQFIEMREMIGRIRIIASRHKQNLVVVTIPHRMAGTSLFPFVQAGSQNILCLFFIIKNAFSVSETMSGKKKCHGKEFFSVRCRTICISGAVRSAGPCEIPFIFAGFHIHISLSPLPDPVKLLLHTQLNTDHHAVGHPLCPRIKIACVLQIGHVLTCLMVEAVLPIKKLMLYLLKAFAYRILRNTHFHKNISVLLIHFLLPLYSLFYFTVYNICLTNSPHPLSVPLQILLFSASV